MNNQRKPKLYIFAISHFSEKARFILDRSGYEYEPIPLTPGEHISILKEFTDQSFVPVLRKSDRVIQGSNEIIHYLYESGRLFTKDYNAEMKWVHKIDETIGYPLQTITYSFLLDYPEILSIMFSSRPNHPASMENFSLVRIGLKRRYNITKQNVKEKKIIFEKGFQTLDQAYMTSSFLLGDTLTIADITAASLISPLIFPPEHPTSSWFQKLNFPEPMAEWIREIQGTTFYNKVISIYKEFRNTKQVNYSS